MQLFSYISGALRTENLTPEKGLYLAMLVSTHIPEITYLEYIQAVDPMKTCL